MKIDYPVFEQHEIVGTSSGVGKVFLYPVEYDTPYLDDISIKLLSGQVIVEPKVNVTRLFYYIAEVWAIDFQVARTMGFVINPYIENTHYWVVEMTSEASWQFKNVDECCDFISSVTTKSFDPFDPERWQEYRRLRNLFLQKQLQVAAFYNNSERLQQLLDIMLEVNALSTLERAYRRVLRNN